MLRLLLPALILCSAAMAASSTLSAAAPTPRPVNEHVRNQPFLGVTPDTATGGNFDGPAGVPIKQIIVGSTSSTLGLRPGDVIVSINGAVVADARDLERAVRRVAVDKPVTVIYRRDGERKQASGTMQAYPSQTAWPDEIERQNKLKQERLQAIRDRRAARQRSGMEQAALTMAMTGIASTLETLPAQIEIAAREYKNVYPEGRFDIELTLHLASHPPEDADDEAEDPADAKTPDTDDDTTAETPDTDDDTTAEPADVQAADETDDPDTVDEAKETIDEERDAAADAGHDALSAALAQLSTSLETFPARLQKAANAFKTIYPDGVFALETSITILPDPDADMVLELGPHGPSATDGAGDAQADGEPEPANDTAPDDDPAGP